MTKTNYELLKSFVEGCVEDMNRSIDWAENKMEKDDEKYRRDWAYDAVERHDTEGQGAISFACFWQKAITEEEKEELSNILFQGWKSARTRISNEMY